LAQSLGNDSDILVIVSGSTVFDLGKLLATSGTKSLPSGFGVSEIGKMWRFRASDLNAWLDRQERAS